MDNSKPSFSYVIHQLMIKLWEWEGVKDKWETEIMKNGPEQSVCEWADTAQKRITEIKAAIKELNKQP